MRFETEHHRNVLFCVAISPHLFDGIVTLRRLLLSHFLLLNDPLKDDLLRLQIPVRAELPHGFAPIDILLEALETLLLFVFQRLAVPFLVLLYKIGAQKQLLLSLFQIDLAVLLELFLLFEPLLRLRIIRLLLLVNIVTEFELSLYSFLVC